MLDRLARKGLQDLDPYIPGKPIEEVKREYGLRDVIKMASNENPWGSSPKALEAIQKEISLISQYPEGSCRQLRSALARRLGVREEMIMVSNGADNVLLMIAQAYVEGDEEVIMAKPTFPIYRTATILMGGIPREIPLRDFTHDVAAMVSAVGPRTKALFICNPNNPTGTIVKRREFDDLLERIPHGVLVVVDEVYGDFATSGDYSSALDFIRDGRAIISVRSFSKLYGLAGLRVGYAIAPQAMIQTLNRVREPFPVNRLAHAAALAALEDDAFQQHVLAETEKGRATLTESFHEMGLRCLPSHTNFLFVDLGTDAQKVFEALLHRGIIIRPGMIWGTPNWCRITIGTSEQNHKLIQALKEVLT